MDFWWNSTGPLEELHVLSCTFKSKTPAWKNCLETVVICSKLSSLLSASRELVSVPFFQCHRISDHLQGVHDDKRLLCIRSYFWQCLIVHIYQIACKSHLLGSLSNTVPLWEFNVSTSWGRYLTGYLFCSLFLSIQSCTFPFWIWDELWGLLTPQSKAVAQTPLSIS